MVVSDLTVDVVKNYLRVDGDTENQIIEMILGAAISYAEDYTGKGMRELDEYANSTLAVLALCADMYEQRAVTISGNVSINPVVAQILGSHSINLI